MRILPVHGIRLLALLFLLGSSGHSVCAQEITFSGIGPINHSLAGTAVALPRDSAGAVYWNPATISFLDYSEFQLGWGRHNPPWYGDEPIGYTGLILLWLTAKVAFADESNDWNSDSDSYYSNTDDRNTPTFPSYKHGKIRVPTFSYVYNEDRHWSFGLAVSEYGAKKAGTLFETNQWHAVGIYRYQFRGYEFIPALSYRESRHFSVGISPIFSIDEMPNATLPLIITEYGVLPQNQRSQAGFGMQIGAFYSPTRRTRFGASVRTPQLINRFTYRWSDPVTGEVHTQRLSFAQDSAFRIVVGASHTLRNDMTTFAADFRYADYSHASVLYDIPASFDSAVKKQGSSRAVYSLALGAEHRPWDILALRMGYQWNHAVTPDKAIIYNTSLPIQSGHSIHYGLTAFFSENFDLSFSISNAFSGGRETLYTEAGQVSFRRNPNRNNLWIAGRMRF